MTKPYHLHSRDTLLRHGVSAVPLIKDMAGRSVELDVLAASGDALVTLATRLDKLATTVAESDTPERDELERIIQALLYLQQYYIVKKKSA